MKKLWNQEEQVKAMKMLLAHYKGEGKVKECSLCVAVKNDCHECVWVKETGADCRAAASSMSPSCCHIFPENFRKGGGSNCLDFLSQTELKDYLHAIKKWRKLRIEQLTQWIKKYDK